MRGGGSIPIVATLQHVLGAPVVLLGFGVPDCGVHAPNEFFPVEQFVRGTEAIIRYYHYLGRG
jgi:acetylornithine deacetylase/succinyl-diaminopimelate desuccinylase-like protein